MVVKKDGRRESFDRKKLRAGLVKACVHNTDCSMRALWLSLQLMLEKVLFQTTLADLLQKESGMQEMLETKHGALILPAPMQSKAAHA